MEPWDKEEIYDEQIRPLVEQMKEICDRHRMPAVVVCVYGQRRVPEGMIEDVAAMCSIDRYTPTARSVLFAADHPELIAPLVAKHEGGGETRQ